jgi:LEA14-like dessication related protein
LEAILLAIVAIVVVVGVLYRIWPRTPRFEVTDVRLKGFKLNWETDSVVPIVAVDIDLSISIKVTNPNVVPIEYTSTIVNLLYRGTSIGEAMVDAGKQASQSEETIIVPAKLNGLELTTHVLQLLSDIAKREMVLNSVVTISGYVKVWKLYHDFEVIPVPILWDHNVLNHSAHSLGKH